MQKGRTNVSVILKMPDGAFIIKTYVCRNMYMCCWLLIFFSFTMLAPWTCAYYYVKLIATSEICPL